MEYRESTRNILDLDVVRDDVSLEPGRQRLFELAVGIDQNVIVMNGQKYMRVHLAFRAENARLNGVSFVRLADIICNLPVQESNAIGTRYPQLRAGGKIKE